MVLTDTREFRALETRYAGYHFRSRSEARWARFMDALDVPYEYEKEGYRLGSGELYLPDFWLPSLSCWLEVKGPRPTVGELNSATELAEGSRSPVHLFWGKVAVDPFWETTLYLPETYDRIAAYWGGLTVMPSCPCGYYQAGMYSPYSAWQECRQCGAISIYNPFAIETDCEPCRHEACACACEPAAEGGRNGSRWTPRLMTAYTSAREARFERGQ